LAFRSTACCVEPVGDPGGRRGHGTLAETDVLIDQFGVRRPAVVARQAGGLPGDQGGLPLADLTPAQRIGQVRQLVPQGDGQAEVPAALVGRDAPGQCDLRPDRAADPGSPPLRDVTRFVGGGGMVGVVSCRSSRTVVARACTAAAAALSASAAVISSTKACSLSWSTPAAAMSATHVRTAAGSASAVGVVVDMCSILVASAATLEVMGMPGRVVRIGRSEASAGPPRAEGSAAPQLWGHHSRDTRTVEQPQHLAHLRTAGRTQPPLRAPQHGPAHWDR
jgi:hypothetical protein